MTNSKPDDLRSREPVIESIPLPGGINQDDLAERKQRHDGPVL
jgi:hypothetical protein